MNALKLKRTHYVNCPREIYEAEHLPLAPYLTPEGFKIKRYFNILIMI